MSKKFLVLDDCDKDFSFDPKWVFPARNVPSTFIHWEQYQPHNKCTMCGKDTDDYCKRCKARYYCSQECQVKDLPRHKEKECLECPFENKEGGFL